VNATVTAVGVQELVAAVLARHAETGTPVAALIVREVPRDLAADVAEVLCSGPSGLTEEEL
jgi:hypothetical protein